MLRLDRMEKEHLLLVKIHKLYNLLPKGRGSQGRILKIVSSHDGISQKELQKILGIKPGSLSEVITKMEKLGYIYRKPSEEDRRIQLVYCTQEGLSAFEEIHKEHIDESQDFFSMLTEEDIDAAIALLDKVLDVYGEPEKHDKKLANK